MDLLRCAIWKPKARCTQTLMSRRLSIAASFLAHARSFQRSHAMGIEGVDSALKAGVDSIEHGYGLNEELIDRMVRQNVYWCPTIYTGVYVAEGRAAEGRPIYMTMRDMEAKIFGVALRKGVKI